MIKSENNSHLNLSFRKYSKKTYKIDYTRLVLLNIEWPEPHWCDFSIAEVAPLVY